jgi:predicted 3-demethylubiquinone-9 3-methyltransferase (glyoxalase superfamily)
VDKISTCLWFDGNAEEAARFYTSIFPDSRIDSIDPSPADTPSGPEGSILTVNFTLGGRSFIGLNGGPEFKFSEAISLSIDCEDQAEVDRYWDALLANGGEPSVCGWLKDRFGLSWQVVPRQMTEMFKQQRPRGGTAGDGGHAQDGQARRGRGRARICRRGAARRVGQRAVYAGRPGDALGPSPEARS